MSTVDSYDSRAEISYESEFSREKEKQKYLADEKLQVNLVSRSGRSKGFFLKIKQIPKIF